MDSTFGICGKDFVIVACDTSVNRSIFTLKHDDDKIMQLNKLKIMGSSGEQTDRYTFSNLVMRNLQLMEFRSGHEPDVESTAQFVRSELATALRKGPYQVNVLLGGYDPIEGKAKLYWMDYLGTLQQVQKGAHGYAGYFVNSVLDNNYHQNMTLEEGVATMKKCIVELRTRFMINQPNFIAKIVTKDGVQVMNLA